MNLVCSLRQHICLWTWKVFEKVAGYGVVGVLSGTVNGTNTSLKGCTRVSGNTMCTGTWILPWLPSPSLRGSGHVPLSHSQCNEQFPHPFPLVSPPAWPNPSFLPKHSQSTSTDFGSWKSRDHGAFATLFYSLLMSTLKRCFVFNLFYLLQHFYNGDKIKPCQWSSTASFWWQGVTVSSVWLELRSS